MTTVLVVQHLPHEHEGVLGEALVARDVTIRRWRAWLEPQPEAPLDVDGLVVLGGDMNTDEGDRWPHLAVVRDLLVRALDGGTPTLGLCLGAQLLAEAGGGAVRHGTPEIGYIPIELTDAGRDDPVLRRLPDGAGVFNAHADFITAPPGAALLARSSAASVHAYRLGAALGLQFHAEIDASYVASYVEAPGVAEYLRDNSWEPAELVRQARVHNEAHRAIGREIFHAWVDML